VDHDRTATFRSSAVFVRRWLALAIVAAGVAGATTFSLSSVTPAIYASDVVLFVHGRDPVGIDASPARLTSPTLDAQAYAAVLRSRPVLADAYRIVTGSDPTSVEVDALRNAVDVTLPVDRSQGVTRVVMRHQDPEQSREFANALAQALIDWDARRAARLRSASRAPIRPEEEAAERLPGAAVTDLAAWLQEDDADDLAREVTTLLAMDAEAHQTLEWLAAGLGGVRVAPLRARDTVFAATLAALLVLGFGGLGRPFDARVRSREHLAKVTSLPLIAEVPRSEGGRRDLAPGIAGWLRTNLSLTVPGAAAQVLIVAGVRPGHGSTTVSIALAESYARRHERVVLVDGNLRRPSLGREYGLSPFHTASLSETLEAPTPHPEPARIALGHGATLDVIPEFEPAADVDSLLAAGMPALLETLRDRYDRVVVDGPPLLPEPDGISLIRDGVAVVVAASLPDAEVRDVVAAIDLLRRAGARLAGTVVTHSRGGSGHQAAVLHAFADGPRGGSVAGHAPRTALRPRPGAAPALVEAPPSAPTPWRPTSPAVVAMLDGGRGDPRGRVGRLTEADLIDESVAIRPMPDPGSRG
jgi:Mrp family chromosome partitioning ATPase